MQRAEKAEVVAELGRIFDESGVVVVAQYAGLTVAQATDLRNRMREQGAAFKVAKNRLAKIALDGRPQEVAKDLFEGQTGIAYSTDPVVAAKVATSYAKENSKFLIVGAALGGQRLDADGVKALAEMPSIEQLRAKLLGILKAPMAKMAGVLKAPPQKMAGVLKAPPQKLIGVLKAYEAKMNEAA